VRELEAACEAVETPLQRLEHALHPWVAFVIMPLFALANAGVALDADVGSALGNRVTLGIVLGLVVGKQAGITLFGWLATRSGLAALPAGVTWRHLYGASWLAGIGFTMSLFIAELAFDTPSLLTSAKLGILAASLIAGAGGWLVLTRPSPAARQDQAAEPAPADDS
jgi:NhaA family Na+:H+ antiporter